MAPKTKDMACHLEALIYLDPASLARPVGEHLPPPWDGSTFPEDIKRDTPRRPDLAQLRDLKRRTGRKKVEAPINRGKAWKEQGQK